MMTDMIPVVFPIGSILSAFATSNIAGQVIVVVLFLLSIVAWSVVVTKWMDLSESWKQTQQFLAAHRKEAHPVALFLKRQRYDASPLYQVYERTCSTLGGVLHGQDVSSGDLFMGTVGTESQRKLSETQLNYVRNVAEKTVADQMLMLERQMGFVAITTTTAPLLGLLGTVWGAMDAFEKAITGGTAMLAQVAPGISGALLTTVIGLLVAIPSGIGYNILADRIRRFGVEMDNLVQELLTSIEHHYLQQR